MPRRVPDERRPRHGERPGVEIAAGVRELRRLLYCGEWIESHTLHIYMLHAPDFLGLRHVIDVAREATAIVTGDRRSRRSATTSCRWSAGAIHPINVRVGGFYRTPRRRELHPFTERLKWALEQRSTSSVGSRDSISRIASVTMCSVACATGRISLQRRTHRLEPRARHHDGEYDAHFEEFHVERSTALHARMRHDGEPISPGRSPDTPQFRVFFPAGATGGTSGGARAGLAPIRIAASSCARSRRVYALDEALRIIARYEEPDALRRDRATRAASATPRPRRRAVCSIIATVLEATDDRRGVITPPTSQNQG